MATHCMHENIAVEATADNCNDGGRVLRLQCRCAACDRLVEFKNIPHAGGKDAKPGHPMAQMGGRSVALPFSFSGSYIGG